MGCGPDLERREPSASTTEAVAWEATLGAERTRGACTEALAHVFDFRAGLMCWLKNCDKGEPRELAGELYTAAEGFFSFDTKERLARLKKTGSCHEEE